MAGMVYQDITLGFYAAEEMSSAAWERKYADVGRAVVQMPGNVEGDDVLDAMVDAANEGESVEAPIVDRGGVLVGYTESDARAAGEAREATNVAPAKPAPTRGEWKTLHEQIVNASDAATPEQIDAMRRDLARFDEAHGRAKLLEAWTANGTLGAPEVAS